MREKHDARAAKPTAPAYRFESAGTLAQRFFWIPSGRDRRSALDEASKLLARIGLEPSQCASALDDPMSRRLLVAFCTDVHLNLEWYHPKVSRLAVYQRMMLLVVFASALALVLFMAGIDGVGEAPASGARTVSEVGLLAAAGLTLLQLMVVVSDRKSQLASFHRAKSDLTELLLDFEETWTSEEIFVPGDGQRKGTLSPPFLDALRKSRARARAIVRREQDEYFEAMKSPTDLLSVLAGGLDAVRQRRREYEEERAKNAPPSPPSAPWSESVRAELAAAEAELTLRREHLTELDKDKTGNPTPELARARAAVADAELLVDQLRRDHRAALLTAKA